MQLTEDHTLVAWQLKQGIISEEEALVSPHKNVITRAVGSREYVQVDTACFDLELGDGSPPPSGAGVVLTSPVLAGSGAVDVVGLARPFEATLEVSLEDASGDPVEAVFSGSDFLGTISTSEYGVGATDWLEAWGMFAVRAEGLAVEQLLAVARALAPPGRELA